MENTSGPSALEALPHVDVHCGPVGGGGASFLQDRGPRGGGACECGACRVTRGAERGAGVRVVTEEETGKARDVARVTVNAATEAERRLASGLREKERSGAGAVSEARCHAGAIPFPPHSSGTLSCAPLHVLRHVWP
eukprot:2657949-Rhodomonas_salina.3